MNIFRQTNHEMKAIDRYTKRNSTGKVTIAVISECPLCFYSVRFGKKCGVLQKLLTGKM